MFSNFALIQTILALIPINKPSLCWPAANRKGQKQSESNNNNNSLTDAICRQRRTSTQPSVRKRETTTYIGEKDKSCNRHPRATLSMRYLLSATLPAMTIILNICATTILRAISLLKQNASRVC